MEADWLRENCNEPISASCPNCGTPIELSSDFLISEKECWVCALKVQPQYQCAKCSVSLESCKNLKDRPCSSSNAFDKNGLVAFQPEGEVWFHRKNTSGKTHIAIDSTLRDELRSGRLPPTTQIYKSGEDKFIEAVDHPSFSGLFPEHAPPALPPPLPPTPTPPHLPVGSKNPIIATSLAMLFGPLGLLYLSWKVSALTFLLHIVCSAIFGWPNWAGIIFWHILPTAIAYWISRKVTSLVNFKNLLLNDLILIFSLIKNIALTKAGAWISTSLFLSGFLYAGSFKSAQWLAESAWAALSFHIILCAFLVRTSFVISKKYIDSINTRTTVYFEYFLLNDTDTLKNWLRWSSLVLMIVASLILWEQNPGLVRVIMIALTICIPFLPITRGAIGAIALGCLGGLASVLISATFRGFLNILNNIIMK